MEGQRAYKVLHHSRVVWHFGIELLSISTCDACWAIIWTSECVSVAGFSHNLASLRSSCCGVDGSSKLYHNESWGCLCIDGKGENSWEVFQLGYIVLAGRELCASPVSVVVLCCSEVRSLSTNERDGQFSLLQ